MTMKYRPQAYNPVVVRAFFVQQGLPAPNFEWQFCPQRKWRFDLTWGGLAEGNEAMVAIEVQGGIWKGGAHARGSGIIKDMEKYNEAACLGWRILFVQPQDLCRVDTANLVKRCLYGGV